SLQCARPLGYRAGPPGRLCGAIAAARASVSPLPAPAHPVRLVGGGADSEYPLWAPPEPLCGVAIDRRRRRGFRRAADSPARHAGGSRLWFGVAWLSLLHMGLHRLCRGYRRGCGHAAVRHSVQERRRAGALSVFARTAVWLVLALTALNVISTLLECGFAACPDNPLVYELLKPRL